MKKVLAVVVALGLCGLYWFGCQKKDAPTGAPTPAPIVKPAPMVPPPMPPPPPTPPPMGGEEKKAQ